ncbi:MAG TPA: DegT/DnrJ/EryC1/StrS family aminotransferase [Acidobacteriota bacterium]
MIRFIDLSEQNRQASQEIFENLRAVAASSQFIGGDVVANFERRFAEYCNSRHCVALNSGTDALRLGLISLSLPRDAEVITTPFSFIACVEAVLQAGLKPCFADIDAESLNLSAQSVNERCGRMTCCVMPVHFGGNPCDMRGLESACGKAVILEDCCQAHGSRICGKHVGTFGAVGAFSFYPTKNLGAWGDGGAAITNDDRLAESIRLLRNHGQSGRYFHEKDGWNSRLDALQAVILSIKLQYIRGWNRERVELSSLYDRLLVEVDEVRLIKKYATAEAVPYLYTVRAREREELKRHLEECGIETRVIYPFPLHLLPATRGLGYGKGDFPSAEQACAEVISLPLYPGLNENNVYFICEKIRDFYH